jgi:hypothetical protein
MPNQKPNLPYSPRVAKRWRCNLRPDAAILRNTRGEAIAWFKQLLGLKKMPPEAVVESF